MSTAGEQDEPFLDCAEEAPPPPPPAAEAERLKAEANEVYKSGDFEAAVFSYTKALQACPLDESNNKLRSILLANRAACHLQCSDNQSCLADCTDAISYDPTYAKAYVRRCRANEGLNKWHDALADIKKAMELDDKLRIEHSENLKRIERESKEQFDKEKEEMMGKMKEFGNFLLGKVGLSTDNFKMEQNESGSYNIKFEQNGSPKQSNSASPSST
eukprot:GHVQ01024698.1.p1 GENE.GHVQ01024698.1~~GHVQ01024698.1.p1  ORF type:complete len:216 (+),score=35.75 GHVQ01024698.1:300-947(+)